MIGDLVLYIKKWWEQNITCIHDYQPKFPLSERGIWMCTKCGRTKNIDSYII